jgi:predicted transcriptional regulator
MPNITRNVSRNLEMATMYFEGAEQKEIAKKYGITQQAVSLALQTDECVKHFIDHASRHQATLLPRVTRCYEKFLTSDDESIQLKACQDITKNTGVAPTHSSTTTINNIMQQNNVIFDPEILQALKSAMAPKLTIDSFKGGS